MEGYDGGERLLAIPRAQLHGPIPRQGGVEVWEVGGDGKAFKQNYFDVTTSLVCNWKWYWAFGD